MDNLVKGWQPRRSSTSTDLADHLRLCIIGGELPEGSRLPAQDVLAQQFGVARSILRDALARLDELGYIHTRRGRSGGSFVRAPRVSAEQGHGEGTDVEDVRSAYDYRMAVEGYAARLAAERRTDTDLAVLDQAVSLDARAGLPLVEFRTADARFHLGLVAATGNTYLEGAVRHARAEVFLRTDRTLFDQDMSTMQAEHRAVLDAVRDGDGAAASESMVRHLRQSLSLWEAMARG